MKSPFFFGLLTCACLGGFLRTVLVLILTPHPVAFSLRFLRAAERNASARGSC